MRGITWPLGLLINDTLTPTMLNVRFSRPAPGLEQFVRFYVQREVQIPGAPIIHPVPARPATMIEFQFSDPVDVLDLNNGILQPSPLLAVVGPQTYRRRDLYLRGTSLSGPPKPMVFPMPPIR